MSYKTDCQVAVGGGARWVRQVASVATDLPGGAVPERISQSRRVRNASDFQKLWTPTTGQAARRSPSGGPMLILLILTRRNPERLGVVRPSATGTAVVGGQAS